MTSNLYEQAIAEAKQLKEMAEQNAKNKIIEAVTPRIKALIEAQIMGEQDDVADDEMSGVDIAMMSDDEESEESADDVPETEEVLDLIDLGTLPEDELLEPPALEDEMSDEVENTSVTVNAQGDVNISVAEGRGRNRVLSKNTRSTTLSGKVNLTENCNSVRRQAKRMDAMLQGLQFNKLNEMQRTLIKKAYQELLSEALLIKRLLLKEGANNKLTTSYKDMIKEIKKMTRRSSAIFRRLFEIDEMADEMREEDEELGGEEMEDEMGDEAEGGDVDVEAASSALEDLAGALDLEIEIGGDAGGEEEEMGDEMGDDDEEEIDLGEIHLGEADGDDEEEEEEKKEVDEVYEIDENILRREIRRLRRIRESEGVDAAVLDDFGGGEEEGDSFVDVDEDDLINALADELGSVAPASVATESRRRNFATRRKNRRAAKLQTENKKLRKQLTEMNLFNAKLLYVNKLMQNRNVTQKQQRAIVEALDNAKTIREAKFLYQGLAKSLVKKTNKINESTNRQRLLSSASKPTRRGSAALNEDAVATRWATLAGIKR